jgi:hypothetical protein
MKKITLLVMTIFLLGFNQIFAQAVEKGTKLVDVYYGWPNLWSSIAKAAITNSNSLNVGVGSTGPFGARFEYMASDKVGFGVDLNYALTTVKFNEETTDGNGNSVTYNYKWSIPRLRALFRFNLHFGGSEKFDAYWTLGAGYSSLNWSYTTNDPNYTDNNVKFNYIPIALRTGIGARYYFSESIGANVELGLGGGPLMTFGLSTKF